MRLIATGRSQRQPAPMTPARGEAPTNRFEEFRCVSEASSPLCTNLRKSVRYLGDGQVARPADVHRRSGKLGTPPRGNTSPADPKDVPAVCKPGRGALPACLHYAQRERCLPDRSRKGRQSSTARLRHGSGSAALHLKRLLKKERVY
jgi:hypothetical protein